jgi:hypothetical protein
MRKSRFMEAQIISMIKEQEAGMPTAEVCLVLSRFCSGLFRAMFAMKETKNGNELHRRVSP